MQEYEIYALHGFLGTAADWNLLQNVSPGAKVHAVDVFSERYGNTSDGLKSWAQAFNKTIKNSKKKRL